MFYSASSVKHTGYYVSCDILHISLMFNIICTQHVKHIIGNNKGFKTKNKTACLHLIQLVKQDSLF